MVLFAVEALSAYDSFAAFSPCYVSSHPYCLAVDIAPKHNIFSVSVFVAYKLDASCDTIPVSLSVG